MVKNKDGVQQKRMPERALDAMDRKLLGVLVADATTSYAELGERVGLSSPAAHERVKRLRRSGTIRRIAAQLNPDAVGKGLLSFVHVDTNGWGGTPLLLAFQQYPEIEEIHSVAGDSCMLLKVRTASTHALEGLLARLYELPCVTATRSYVVLSTYLERSVQPEITAELLEPLNSAEH